MSATPAPVTSQALRTPDVSADTLLGTTDRLQQSRQKMRHQMLELNAHSARAAKLIPGHSSGLMGTLIALPIIGPMIESAASWWENHPLHVLADLFSRSRTSATDSQKRTLTQQHPWAMLLGAVGLGALLMWTRPWRFGLLRRAVYAGLVPQVLGSLLSRVSGDGLLDLVSSVLRRSTDSASPLPATKQPGGNEGTAPGNPLH